MRRHIILTMIGIGLCAHAQVGIENADSVKSVLQEVVVTGNKASKANVSTAPLRMLDTEQMLQRGVVDVADALQRMPGVNLRDYGGAGGLKTVSVRGFGAGHTGVFYDGVPLSDAQSGQIDLSRYSIDNVGNVGLVVGDNEDILMPARLAASAATVNISTMPQMQGTELTAKMRIGSFGCYNPFLRAGTNLSENFAANVVGEFLHADNDYPFTLKNGTLITKEKRTNSRMNSGHAELNTLWQISNSTSLSTKVYYYKNSRQLPGPVIYYNNVSNEHLCEENIMAQGMLRTRLSSKISLSGIMKYNYASSLYHDENGKYPGGVLDQNYWQREYYTSWMLLYAISHNWLFDYSVDYFYNNLNSNLISNSHPYRNSLLQSVTAKYKTGRLTVMARLLASVYDNGAKNGEAAKDATKLSPSVSLSYKPFSHEQLYLRASYKNIFRMPTFNEAYFDHYGSTNVLPESTDQFNVGVTYSMDGNNLLNRASFTVDGYINNIHDMIVAVPYNMFVWSMINLGKVRTYGIDVTGELEFSIGRRQSLNFAVNYSFQRAMPKTSRESSEWNKQVAYIPKNSGSASVSYENPWVNISLSATGVSERFTTNNNLPATKIDGYMDFHLSAWHAFSIGRHSLDLKGDVINLFDKQYYIVARYPMPGRQYRFTLTFRY